MFELGTDRMWAKVCRWGLLRDDSLDGRDRANGPHHRHMENTNSDFQSKGRMIDDYYFDKSKRRDSRGEYKAMCPRSPSEENRMMRIALEASKREREIEAEEEEEFRLDNFGSNKQQQNDKASVPPSKLSSIGEDNLIDFGVDDAAKAVSQINISRQSTDVSVLGDDDATTASFVMNTAWNSNSATDPPPAPQQSGLSPRYLYPNQYQQRPPQQQQQQQMPHYHDPTFNHAHYTQPQRPWSSAGTVSSNPTTPRGGGLPPSDASFAVPPPPTLADYKQAFGSTMSMAAGSVYGNSMMSPMSNSSVGTMSPMAAHMQQSQQKVAVGGPSMASNKFDPLRSDPFA